jgi:hypothetical protein
MNYWKWALLAGLIIVAFFLGRCNGIESITKNVGSDTTIVYNVVDTQYIPQPYAVINNQIQYKTRRSTDTLFLEGESNTVYVPEGTPDWIVSDLNDYNKTVLYDTTWLIGNNSITVKDTVKRNRITGRGLKGIFTDTTITKTVVVYPQRRMVGYFTLGALGNFKGDMGIAGGFQLKLKNDATFQYELLKVNQIPLMHKYTMGIPIRLIKPKNR